MTPRGTAIAVAVTAAVLAAMPAAAQTPELTATMELEMTPPKGGTKAKPRGIKLSGQVGFKVPPGLDRPTILSGRLLLPAGIVFNGQRYPICPLETLDRKGPSGCPKASVIGKQEGVAFAGGFESRPDVVILNGGRRRLWAYTTLYRPTLVKEPVAITLAKPKSRQWSYELRFTTPEVLRVVAGIPIGAPESTSFSMGGTRLASRIFATNQKCPPKGFRRYVASFDYASTSGAAGKATARGRLACD